ncbi:hypothetical protein CRG98_041793, partial [Punica granatum]
MNRAVAARSLVRCLIRNGGGNRHQILWYSSSSSLARPSVTELWRQSGASGGGVVQHWVRTMSSGAAGAAVKEKENGTVEKALQEAKEKKEKESGSQVEVSSYWGVTRPKITKEDGTEWPWNCFMPWETYRADLSIDLKKHHVPKTFADKVAYRTVKLLRIPTDIFFQ